MLNIPIQLWPLGFSRHSEEIGRITIYNDGTSGSNTLGNYVIEVTDPRNGLRECAMLRGFLRKQNDQFDLLYLALHQIMKKRKRRATRRSKAECIVVQDAQPSQEIS